MKLTHSLLLMIACLTGLKVTAQTSFTYVEKMPEFQGNINQYLGSSIMYPTEAREEGIEGRVVVRFTIKGDGTIDDIIVKESVHPLLDNEAIRVIRGMKGMWTPGTQKGEPVDVYFTIPINFSLGEGAIDKLFKKAVQEYRAGDVKK